MFPANFFAARVYFIRKEKTVKKTIQALTASILFVASAYAGNITPVKKYHAPQINDRDVIVGTTTASPSDGTNVQLRSEAATKQLVYRAMKTLRGQLEVQS